MVTRTGPGAAEATGCAPAAPPASTMAASANAIRARTGATRASVAREEDDGDGGFAVRRHRHPPQRRIGTGPLGRDRLALDLGVVPPIVEPALRDFDRHRHVARIGDAVAHRRAPFILAELLALLDGRLYLHVERLSGPERQPRSHRRVADIAFADELRLPPRIAHIDAHRARGQRVAEAALARRIEAQHRLRALRLGLRAEPAIAEEIGLGRGRTRDVEEAHLLLLGIGDRSALAERIDVEIAEPLAVGALGAG